MTEGHGEARESSVTTREAALDRVRRQMPSPLAISEAQWLRQVRDLAKFFGWATFHPFLSIHSERGWPDLALCRPPRLILAELKSDRGKTTPAQDAWLERLGLVPGVETYVWRPNQAADVARILR